MRRNNMTNFFAAGIDVTNKCTLRCLHCFNSSGGLKNQRMDEMSDEELERMAYDVIDCRPVSICMCGGEPLLRKESIYKIANYSKNTCVDVNMVTNGELMTKEIAKKLWQSGISSIQVSLDGSTEEVVDWLRNKKGAYKNAINAIKYLDDTRQELGINRKISVSFIPHKKNFEQLEEVIYLCETLNVDSFRAQPLMLLGRAMDNLNTYKLNYKAYEESYHIFSLISDTKGNTVYQSDFPFPTSADKLLHDVEKQISTQPLSQTESTTTSQGGFLEIKGKHHDTYFVIPATIMTANDTVYHGTFLYQTAGLTDILQKTLPIYLLIWLLACIVVIILTRYLLKKSFAPTERILQSQKDFVATASHELKSPLAVMISNTDMLLDNVPLNEQARQAVQTIDFECMRLSRLVKDMLLLASSDAKTWTLHKSTINVDTLLITLYETYEPVCMKQNLELKLHLSEESYPAMLTDKDRLFQILCVFMDNAIQHSKNNSLIEIEVIATEKNIAFSVADHGQGISDEDKQYIFDRFYSGDKSHTNKSNFGLGLSIAKELTQMLNGTITINDTAGGGATFTVKFPLK